MHTAYRRSVHAFACAQLHTVLWHTWHVHAWMACKGCCREGTVLVCGSDTVGSSTVEPGGMCRFSSPRIQIQSGSQDPPEPASVRDTWAWAWGKTMMLLVGLPSLVWACLLLLQQSTPTASSSWGGNSSSARWAGRILPLKGRHGVFRERGLLRVRDPGPSRQRELLRNGSLRVGGSEVVG